MKLTIMNTARSLRHFAALALLATLVACSGGAPTQEQPVTQAPPVADYTGPAPATPRWPPAARSGAAAGAILPIVARPKAVKYVQKGGASKRRRAVQPAGRAYSFCPGAQPTGPAPRPPLWPPAARSGGRPPGRYCRLWRG